MKNVGSFSLPLIDPSCGMTAVAPRTRLETPLAAVTDLYFTFARKLGVCSAPMSACLDAFAAALGASAAVPWIAGSWRVTCAEY
jgi:hypothetical protein